MDKRNVSPVYQDHWMRFALAAALSLFAPGSWDIFMGLHQRGFLIFATQMLLQFALIMAAFSLPISGIGIACLVIVLSVSWVAARIYTAVDAARLAHGATDIASVGRALSGGAVIVVWSILYAAMVAVLMAMHDDVSDALNERRLASILMAPHLDSDRFVSERPV